jgi:hypothetical protein
MSPPDPATSFSLSLFLSLSLSLSLSLNLCLEEHSGYCFKENRLFSKKTIKNYTNHCIKKNSFDFFSIAVAHIQGVKMDK